MTAQESHEPDRHAHPPKLVRKRPDRENALVNLWFGNRLTLITGGLLILTAPALVYAAYKALRGDTEDLVSLLPFALTASAALGLGVLLHVVARRADRERVRDTIQAVRKKSADTKRLGEEDK